MLHGVPEGSILDPHLFNIYIDSLLRSLPADSVVAYADDVTLVSHGASPVECTSNMQGLLNIVNSWFCTNLMAANSSKCFTMFISPYILNGRTISANVLHWGTTRWPLLPSCVSTAWIFQMTCHGWRIQTTSEKK